MSSLDSNLVWGHSALRLVAETGQGRPVAAALEPGADSPAQNGGVRPSQPLVEVLTAGTGRAHVSRRFSETVIGRRLAFVGSEQRRDDRWHELRIDLHDHDTGIGAEVTVRSADGVGACQVRTRLTNRGDEPIVLLGVTSFATCLPGRRLDDLDVIKGDSEWVGENRWSRERLRAAIPDLNLALHGQDGRGCLAVTSSGTWSTGTHLPTGGVVDNVTGNAWMWQVEHNGPWRWEVGERRDGLYVAALGPTDVDHQFWQRLEPGASFTTVPVSIAVSAGDAEGAMVELTRHRRALSRPHHDRDQLPVVFNDYMNTVMGDPTTAKLLPLVDAAAAAGAEVFCVDAGWYDDEAAADTTGQTSWWDSVGEWQPSQTRFPRGIEEVLGRIRGQGMVPGLWLEPEVIGVRSPMADKLPAEAFLQRGGARLVEHGRYHLDLRHARAVAHLDEVVDRLVEELGIGYVKLDYNIDPGTGTDLNADSTGAGLLGHHRAYLAWLDRVHQRHPDLILENCASGGMRMDYALLSRMQLQSTSDQQDWRLYPPVAVSSPMSVIPEQSASWAYPQPEMDDEQLAFTMCTGMLGRLYLSGRLDAMDDHQRESVSAAVEAYHEMRQRLVTAVPSWPLGLPGWDDRWLSLALRTGDVTYVGVWRREDAGDEVTLQLPHLSGRDVRANVVYPRHLAAWTTEWDAAAGALTLTDTSAVPYAARIYRIT